MSLLQRYKNFIQANQLFTTSDRLLLAVSGGLDSVVLCELCKQAGYDFSIAHCNFQLREADSDRDEEFVNGLAQRYKVNFHLVKFETKKFAEENKLSTQEAARNLRYNWFEEIRVKNDYRYILTAHHADDNIETVLMKFFRGTGVRGMRGIESKKGSIVRPLLFARRKQLEEFLAEQQLEFVSDYTNQQDDYTRNYFRNQMIPMIEKSMPGASENILSNIDRFREVEQLYQQALDMHKKQLLERKRNEIHIPVLKLKQREPLQTIVYEIIRDFGFSSAQTPDVISLLDSDTGKYVKSSSHQVIRNRKWLVIAPLQPILSEIVMIEEGQAFAQCAMMSFQLWMEEASEIRIPTSNQDACLDAYAIKFPLLLRRWKQGDYFYPQGMQKKKKLSRFFIDLKLSKSEKENTWVLESDKKIIWVVGHRIDDRFKITDKTKNVLVIKSSLLPVNTF